MNTCVNHEPQDTKVVKGGQRSEDSSQESVFCLHDVDPRDVTRVLMQMPEPVGPSHQPFSYLFLPTSTIKTIFCEMPLHPT